MNLREIIKEKMPLFTKGKYFSIFSDILMNIKSILKKENDSKIKLFFKDK